MNQPYQERAQATSFWAKIFAVVLLLGGPALAAYVVYQNNWLQTGGLVLFAFAMAFMTVGGLFAVRNMFLSNRATNWVYMCAAWALGIGLAYWAVSSFRTIVSDAP